MSASWFMSPNALTAASRTSATSQRNNGTTTLYSDTGDGEIAFDLSLRSAFNESGDELRKIAKTKRIFSSDAKSICFEWAVNRVSNVVQKHTKCAGGEVLLFIVLVMYWVSIVVTLENMNYAVEVQLFCSLLSIDFVTQCEWVEWKKSSIWSSHKVFGVCVMPKVYYTFLWFSVQIAIGGSVAKRITIKFLQGT